MEQAAWWCKTGSQPGGIQKEAQELKFLSSEEWDNSRDSIQGTPVNLLRYQQTNRWLAKGNSTDNPDRDEMASHTSSRCVNNTPTGRHRHYTTSNK